jgi:folate-binding protein YgfZ
MRRVISKTMTDSASMAMMASDRTVLRLGGAEVREFLQGLVSNDVRRLDAGAVYAALLSPQGKYLFDFFLIADGPDVLVDVAADRAGALAQRLTLYRLRRAVTIEPADLVVAIGIGPAPAAGTVVADPRHPALGWRAYGPDAAELASGMAPLDPAEMTRLRIAHGVPEAGVELIPDESYILEMGFERLHGVDFRKGCYVGQEVTARMKHKTDLRKGLVRLRIDGSAPVGTEIEADGKSAGVLYTQSGGRALAHMRFDRIGGPLTAGPAQLLAEDATDPTA